MLSANYLLYYILLSVIYLHPYPRLSSFLALDVKREQHQQIFGVFYLRLYGVTHMVKDHSDSERGNPLPPHGLLFPISSKGSFICIIPQTTAFVNPVVEDWLEREIAQWVHPMNDRSDDPSHHERTLLHGATSRSCIRPTGP